MFFLLNLGKTNKIVHYIAFCTQSINISRALILLFLKNKYNHRRVMKVRRIDPSKILLNKKLFE